MAKYLLIESRDPFEHASVVEQYELAAMLATQGDTVTLFLVQNGVFPVRQSKHSEQLEAAAKAGVEVLADDFSLRERGIPPSRVVSGVQPAPLSIVIDQLAEGRKALWH